jgi:DNA-binding CsgD family transcriptional regulator
MRLVHRHDEVEALDRLLDAARAGLSGALVVRGEPGIGKTALLGHALESAADLRVARVSGIESEMELGFAALHQLLIPFLPRLDDLPEPQRAALRSAFGLVAGPAPNRFLVGLAVLTLLSNAAGERPLLCVVDDAQWLDHASSEVLAFVARRLYADGIALIFAARCADPGRTVLDGLPCLSLEGLPDAGARKVLMSALQSPLNGRVRDRIITEACGNPLALTELVGELTARQLAGASPLPEPLHLGERLEARFLRRVRALPKKTQALLLLVAASPSDDAALIWQGAERLGINAAAGVVAEADRLISLGPPIAFRHPLIRSAIYYGASVTERRRAHDVLGSVSDPRRDADRRAWHLAAAANGPDETVAAELERSADRARARGGYAAAAAFFARAAELGPEGARRGERKLAAAQAELAAGAPLRAEILVEEATQQLVGQLHRAQARRLRGNIRFALGHGSEAPGILLGAARALEPVDPRLARETLLEAFEAAHWAGSLTTGAGMPEVARAARAAPRLPSPLAPAPALLLDGLSTLLTAGHRAGVPLLRRAITALAAAELRPDDGLRWLGLGSYAAGELFDDDAVRVLTTRWVDLARAQGALTTLPTALAFSGGYEVFAGRFSAADARFEEGRQISAATGNPGVVGATAPQQLLLVAWRGHESETRALAASLIRDATGRGQGKVVAFCNAATTVLELGLGNYDAALASALSVTADDPFYLGTQVLADLVEAAARTGSSDAAGLALERLAGRAAVSGTDLAKGMLARSRALLAGGADAERLYQAAVDRLKRTDAAPQLARAYLLYGEWLRRRRRRRDARDTLRVAHELFQAIGAHAFAERARNELLATGERARKRSVETLDDLTPREVQIARLASEGARNPEIAAQLFISPSTVAYHLRKVYRKLGINSRNELAPLQAGASLDEAA